ncbi:MAG: chromosome segregation protein SMC [Planctomycetaceae bacterium]|nr:chromosome segregation protein SMC [Planctomycetaceae bacterium]
MLKALELNGFKSFADKTRFEFPPGITVVVGPNGSGKSNIVDAIKWVLGEQSAKSLRGREMADVIFKGSGGAPGTRRAANTAEATIFFENQDRLLPVDSDEVRITRRVYRSGEGEYLINGDACRLRDVRDLCRGTGVGTDAYSLIEQGKVDTLLQASARERRAIFEEAAGISRFKAKKVETQRRLERVEQNLTRLADIVDEVESRLRSVRNQASKARRYKEYNDRLRELRTHVGMTDWRRLTGRLNALNQRLQETQQELETLQSSLTENEASQRDVDQQTEQVATTLHEAESSVANVREQMAHHRSAVQHERERLAELEHEIHRFRRQGLSMTSRAGDLGHQVDEIQKHVDSAAEVDAEVRTRLAGFETELETTTKAIDERRLELDRRRKEHGNLLRAAGDLGREISSLDAEIEASQHSVNRSEKQHQTLTQQLESAIEELTNKQEAEHTLEDLERNTRDELGKVRRILQAREQRLNLTQQDLIDRQRRHAVANERANVLEDLERRREGLSPGVKSVLAEAQEVTMGPLKSVHGLVADLIRVDVGMAPLIDVALGDLTEHVIVSDHSLAEAIAAGEIQPKGRLGLLQLAPAETNDEGSFANLTGARGVLGRADKFIEVDKPFQDLVQHLLCNTWCVETLSDALRLRQEHASSSLRFVTRSGELLQADGRLLAGPRQAGVGLVSRRSELRSLQQEIIELASQIRQSENKSEQLKSEIGEAEETVEDKSNAYNAAAADLTEARVQCRAAGDRHAILGEQLEGVSTELIQAQEKLNQAQQQRGNQTSRQKTISDQVHHLETELEERQEQLNQDERKKQDQTAQVTTVKVELAKSEQRLDNLKGQLIRFQEDQKDRTRALDELQSQLQQARSRHRQSSRLILDSTSQLAELYLADEHWQRKISHFELQRESLHQQKLEFQRVIRENRGQLHQLKESRHHAELEANQAELEREGLASRVREDYQIELSEVDDETDIPDEEARQREEIDQEIEELRRKLSNIGAVNMAALEEIEDLEQRHETLAAQYQDLSDAKDSLARIIHKINADSRRLFTESLEHIRTNFQALFRRVFGGGQADIVLEEGVDILEAGIDIIATPPGKHSLGISLLSGGERALTAVTLLLAIFQYRPSPFCVLDEVDGPLDEANIGRFTDVLTEFLQWTKFVVVTHSKKTMTAATTLYGVTMQESGISKRVSVQFEDVSDGGHIRTEAIHNSSESDPPPDGPPDDTDDEQAA